MTFRFPAVARRLLTVSLLIFTTATAAAIVWEAVQGGEDAPVSSGGEISGPRFIAYHLAGRIRCSTCTRIEELSRLVMVEEFSRELDSGRLAFRAVNTDLPENRHFIEDFQLGGSSLVLAEHEGGRVVRWKNLAEVWTTVEDEPRFREYVHRETAAFLGGG